MSQKRKGPTNLGLADMVNEVCELGFPLGKDADHVRRQMMSMAVTLRKTLAVSTPAQAVSVRNRFRTQWPPVRELFLHFNMKSETILVRRNAAAESVHTQCGGATCVQEIENLFEVTMMLDPCAMRSMSFNAESQHGWGWTATRRAQAPCACEGLPQPLRDAGA